MSLIVLTTGAFTTIQDLGRFGYLSSGVGVSGAFDRRALRTANRIVGNDETAAGLECLGGGLALKAMQATVVTITGAMASITLNERVVGHSAPLHLNPNETISIGTTTEGIRVYLAVAGGIDVKPVLNSRSYDTLAKLGSPPLKPTEILPVGIANLDRIVVDSVPTAPHRSARLTIHPGPHLDYFADDAQHILFSEKYEVSPTSDRIGIRLTGRPIPRFSGREVPSAPMLRGAIQVPPDGQPVILGPDHPVTGGYPVIGVVADDDVDALAQLRPGERVQFAR